MEEEEVNKEQNTPQENENNIPIEREESPESISENLKTELALKTAELESVIQKIAELEKQNLELKDTLLRKAAEFENYKKQRKTDMLIFDKIRTRTKISSSEEVLTDVSNTIKTLRKSV